MAEAVEAGDIDVVALAPLPSTPLLSSAALKVALGLFLGLALGMVIAYILEALNTSVRRPEDLEAVLHVPGLAVIPRITDGSRSAQSHFRRLLGSGKAAKQTGRLAADRQPDLLHRHRGVPESPDRPDLVGRRRDAADAGGHQRRAGRGQDHDRRQPGGHPGVRRAAGAAGGLRHPPSADPRALPAAACAGADGAAPRLRRSRRRPSRARSGRRRWRGSRCSPAARCR